MELVRNPTMVESDVVLVDEDFLRGNITKIFFLLIFSRKIMLDFQEQAGECN